MTLPFTPNFRFTSGPLKGCLTDDGDQWRKFYWVESYATTSDRMRQLFLEWCYEGGHAPFEENWNLFLESWDEEPIKP